MSLQTVDSVNSVIQNLNKTTNQINILITDTQDIIKVLPILFGTFIALNIIIIILLIIITCVIFNANKYLKINHTSS